MKQKKVFKTILSLLAILLIILPFLVSFNEFLTKIVERFTLYTWIQDQVVPIQVKMVSILSSIFGISVSPYRNGMMVKGKFLEMTWNCIGWQSLLLLTITFWAGLRGNCYTWISKIETVIYGLLGIFWINVLRLTMIVALYNYLTPLYAYVYHDYFAAIVTAIYLFVFWWFAYTYVLKERGAPAWRSTSS
jgi:exosortase/archaeosortase family protein